MMWGYFTLRINIAITVRLVNKSQRPLKRPIANKGEKLLFVVGLLQRYKKWTIFIFYATDLASKLISRLNWLWLKIKLDFELAILRSNSMSFQLPTQWNCYSTRSFFTSFLRFLIVDKEVLQEGFYAYWHWHLLDLENQGKRNNAIVTYCLRNIFPALFSYN